MTKTLFESYVLGSLTLSNRIVMAPLTRNGAAAGFVPSDLAAEYYAQRASAGLIISEATQISQQGQGYQDTPGIYTQAQIEGWRKVTDAVHAKGGHIFLQLWHGGRVSHADLQPNGQAPVAPRPDLFAFGRPFIANPDLVERLKIGAPLASFNPAALYGGGAAGYADYPAIAT